MNRELIIQQAVEFANGYTSQPAHDTDLAAGLWLGIVKLLIELNAVGINHLARHPQIDIESW
jgi:hypothetical protein